MYVCICCSYFFSAGAGEFGSFQLILISKGLICNFSAKAISITRHLRHTWKKKVSFIPPLIAICIC